MRSDAVTSSFSKISIFICQLGVRWAFLSDTLERKANPRKKLLAHGRWWPLENIPLRMGLNPRGRVLLLFGLFLTFVRGTTPVTGTTPVLFSFFVGLITKRAHVFLTNTSRYFYLPKSRSAAMTNICLLRGELNWQELVTSFNSSLRMYNSHCMLTNLNWTETMDILKVQV